MQKTCNHCQKTLPPGDFSKNMASPDGLDRRCRSCAKYFNDKYRLNNVEALRLRKREYYSRLKAESPEVIKARAEANNKLPGAKEAAAARRKKYDKENRLKRMAHNKVAKGLAAGRLKQENCAICFNKAEAHHPDYSKPTCVVWLCRDHHKLLHSLEKYCNRAIEKYDKENAK